MEDYDFFVRDRELFCGRLEALAELRGRAVVDGWTAKVRAGEIEPVVRELLVKHYDPGYAASIRRNFRLFGEARTISLADRSPRAMKRAALEIFQA
jgi:tRNA 2-selenouridine synthase